MDTLKKRKKQRPAVSGDNENHSNDGDRLSGSNRMISQNDLKSSEEVVVALEQDVINCAYWMYFTFVWKFEEGGAVNL